MRLKNNTKVMMATLGTILILGQTIGGSYTHATGLNYVNETHQQVIEKVTLLGTDNDSLFTSDKPTDLNAIPTKSKEPVKVEGKKIETVETPNIKAAPVASTPVVPAPTSEQSLKLGDRKIEVRLKDRKEIPKKVEPKKEASKKEVPKVTEEKKPASTNKPTQPKKMTQPKKVTKPKPVKQPAPKMVEEKKVEPVIVEPIVEEPIEVEPIKEEEPTERIRTVTTSRLEVGEEDSTPYDLLSPIVTEADGARKQYITRSEVADIIYVTMGLEVDRAAGPYLDIDNTIYMMASNAAIQNKYMLPVSKTEFGAWDKITWDELSHIIGRVRDGQRFNGRMGKMTTNKNLGINEIMIMHGKQSTEFPTKSIVVKLLEGVIL